MQKPLFGLLAVLVVILCGTIAFWFTNTPRAISDEQAALAMSADTGLRITSIARRRPAGLVINGIGTPGAELALMRGDRNLASTSTTSDGAFEMITGALPELQKRGEPLLLQLVSTTTTEENTSRDTVPLALLNDDAAQPDLFLQGGNGAWMPAIRPAGTSGILTITEKADSFWLAGQAPTGSALYIYADQHLIEKIILPAPLAKAQEASKAANKKAANADAAQNKPAQTVETSAFVLPITREKLAENRAANKSGNTTDFYVEIYPNEGSVAAASDASDNASGSPFSFALPAPSDRQFEKLRFGTETVWRARNLNLNAQKLNKAKDFPGRITPLRDL